MATVLGICGVVVIAVALAPFGHQITRSFLGLLLVIPVVAVALFGGRWPAYITAAAAGVTYSLRLTPAGSMRITVAEDLTAVLVFFGVALVVSTLVSRRIEALTRLERERGLLLRSVSHDLRTPLAAIRAAATEMLDEPDHQPAVQRRMLQLIDDEAQRLDRLVANLLSLGRIEANAMSPELEPVDLIPLVHQCVSRTEERLRTDIQLTELVRVDGPLTIDGDRTQLDQLVMNLLDNAVRHSPPGGRVEVALDRRRVTVRLNVSDQGPGVPHADTEAIFEPFRSGGMAGSNGVGLAICRAITQAHNGTIHVQDNPGGGAVFVVELPIK
ncbi:hypothetical protein BH10ACT3_BH10ACT3_18120 [soil metagenome]